MTTFSEFDISDSLQQVLKEMNFTQPTPVQEKVIPQILESSQDLIALAQTGTGKTAAFSLPVLTKMDDSQKHVQTVVLSPTRELAMQIAKDMRGFSKNMRRLNVVAVYGGASIHDQIRDIKRGAQVVVGTPGRMLDLVNRGVLKLGGVKWAILDEADEMLKMGFVEDITSILGGTPKDKQTLLFSATMSPVIARIAKKYMHDSIRIEVKASQINKDAITHQYMMVPAKDKITAFKRYKALNPNMYGILFCRTRRECQEIGDALLKEGISTGVLHGEIEQRHRTRIMDAFKRKETTLLVATDVAARGIDVEKLTHVIHVGVPEKSDSYTHRSGRTGRANEKGISLILAHLREHYAIRRIENFNKIKFEEVKLPKREDMIQADIDNYLGRIQEEREVQPLAKKYADEILKEIPAEGLELIAKKAILLAVEESIKKFPIEQIDNQRSHSRGPKGAKGPRGPREYREHSKRGSEQNMETLVISVGRRNQLTVPNLLGMINDVTRGERVDVGHIQLGDTNSSFEVPSNFVDKLCRSMSTMKFKGYRVRVHQGSGVKRGGRSGSSRGYQGKRKAKRY